MEVSIIFDPAFTGESAKAVWIVNTALNKEWFRGKTDLDPNSALFSVDNDQDREAAIVYAIWNAQEHHPAWERINLYGADLTPHIESTLRHDGEISLTPDGFRLLRRRPS